MFTLLLLIYVGVIVYEMYGFWKTIGKSFWDHYLFPFNMLAILFMGGFWLAFMILWPIVFPIGYIMEWSKGRQHVSN
jgi:hypothetical protein